MEAAPSRSGPEVMRQLVRDYVWTVHATYLDHVRHLPPGVRGSLPLLSAGHVTVAAAAARRLHLVAVTTTLPGGADHEHQSGRRRPRRSMQRGQEALGDMQSAHTFPG